MLESAFRQRLIECMATNHNDLATADISAWLIEDTWDQRFIDVILVELCRKLRLAGFRSNAQPSTSVFNIPSGWAPDYCGSPNTPRLSSIVSITASTHRRNT